MQQNHSSSSCFASKCLSCTTNKHCPSDHPSIYPPICMHACNKQIIHSHLQWMERPTWDSISMFQRKLLSRCSSVAISGSVDTVGANLKGMKPWKLSHQQRTENTMPLLKTKQNHQFCLQAVSSSAPKLWNALPQSIREADSLVAFHGRLKTYMLCEWLCTMCLYLFNNYDFLSIPPQPTHPPPKNYIHKYVIQHNSLSTNRVNKWLNIISDTTHVQRQNHWSFHTTEAASASVFLLGESE